VDRVRPHDLCSPHPIEPAGRKRQLGLMHLVTQQRERGSSAQPAHELCGHLAEEVLRQDVDGQLTAALSDARIARGAARVAVGGVARGEPPR
jgi:hypothetical protein